MTPETQASRLFTWRDVRERVAGLATPPWKALELDHQGLFVHSDDAQSTWSVLGDCLGAAFDHEGRRVRLRSVAGSERWLPVVIAPAAEATPPPAIPRPLWASAHRDAHPDSARPDGPVIAAFFSFKGGVGRTTTCFATALQLIDRANAARVLFIDADVEAPGLTWLVGPEERLSWLDALSLVHDADDWKREALPLIAEEVRLAKVQLELPSGRREFFFMPATRTLQQLQGESATPEIAVRRRGRAWVVGDLLISLAEQLEVDVVLVDLRAGLSEFSSPVLLDPRVRNIMVTSCAEQAVQGTVHAMRLVQARTEWSGGLELVVTQVPPEATERFADVSNRLLDAWGADEASTSPTAGDEPVPQPHRIDFASELLVFEDLHAVARRLPGTSLWRVAGALAEQLSPPQVPLPEPVRAPTVDTGDVRRRIREVAESLEFAEANAKLGLLATPPLQSLAEVPPGRPPVAVVVGAKGAGKTFAWGQVVVAGRWSVFQQAVKVVGTPSNDALVFPLFGPTNTQEGLREAVRNAELNALGSRSSRASLDDLKARLRDAPPDVVGERFWASTIADRLGLQPCATIREVDSAVAATGHPLVLVVDGLEDALQFSPNSDMTPGQIVVLRSLLTDLPNRLVDADSTHVGLVVFVRSDIARRAIPQNFEQFQARHRKYALEWSEENALRLVLWLLARAGWELLVDDRVANAPKDELAEALYPLWNRNLGGKRDAHTASWVVAALSDLKGRFQARDLVRLVQHACAGQKPLPVTPAEVRHGLEECSKRKVDELEQEITGLKPIFDKLRSLEPDQKRVPIGRTALELNDDQVKFLDEQGYLYFDEKERQYYMPEIIRSGLGFQLSRRGRARVQSLQRAAAARRR